MNKKSQVFLYSIMLGLVIIILVLALAPSVKESTDNAMNSSSENILGMDCNNESISTFDKTTCVAVDVGFNFYFLGSLIFIGGGILVTKIIFS